MVSIVHLLVRNDHILKELSTLKDLSATEMPNLIGSGQPHPFEFVDQGDTLVFRSEAHDIVRNIHMEQTSIPDDEPHARLGYSIGEWEDDNTLVVYTARINWPYFSDGTRQSEQVESVE
ncbi:MAG: hypothetical protein V3R80_11630, partial [Candidatus Tectomicrobia bacterium]